MIRYEPKPYRSASHRLAFAKRDSQYQRYAYDQVERKYLHMSGEGFTEKSEYAWCGFPKQFRELVKKDPDLQRLELINPEEQKWSDQ